MTFLGSVILNVSLHRSTIGNWVCPHAQITWSRAVNSDIFQISDYCFEYSLSLDIPAIWYWGKSFVLHLKNANMIFKTAQYMPGKFGSELTSVTSDFHFTFGGNLLQFEHTHTHTHTRTPKLYSRSLKLKSTQNKLKSMHYMHRNKYFFCKICFKTIFTKTLLYISEIITKKQRNRKYNLIKYDILKYKDIKKTK